MFNLLKKWKIEQMFLSYLKSSTKSKSPVSTRYMRMIFKFEPPPP